MRSRELWHVQLSVVACSGVPHEARSRMDVCTHVCASVWHAMGSPSAKGSAWQARNACVWCASKCWQRRQCHHLCVILDEVNHVITQLGCRSKKPANTPTRVGGSVVVDRNLRILERNRR